MSLKVGFAEVRVARTAVGAGGVQVGSTDVPFVSYFGCGILLRERKKGSAWTFGSIKVNNNEMLGNKICLRLQ